MKVAFLVTHFPVLSETFIINQIVGLIERGHDVDIYVDRHHTFDQVHPDVELYNLLQRTYYLPQIDENLFLRIFNGLFLFIKNLWQNPVLTLRSLNFWKYGKSAVSLYLLYSIVPNLQQKYDIIHCQFGTLGFRGMAFLRINSPDAKLITTFRGHDISSFVKTKGTDIYDELFRTGDLFLANCDYFKQRAIALGCDPDKIIVHRSGLDCDKFPFSVRHQPVDGKIRIATIGRLVEKKGIEYAIRAVAKLKNHANANIEYNIIGDGKLKLEFQRLINDLNIGNIVNLLGWKNEQEIREILDKSHIFIAPSVTAANGDRDAPINVLKEAMSMGLPVISTYHGGIPELVEDGVSGYLIPERDADALADKLIDLLDHPDWEKMGRAGRSCVEQHYNLHKLNDKLVNIYQQLITDVDLSKVCQKQISSSRI